MALVGGVGCNRLHHWLGEPDSILVADAEEHMDDVDDTVAVKVAVKAVVGDRYDRGMDWPDTHIGRDGLAESGYAEEGSAAGSIADAACYMDARNSVPRIH